MSRIRNTGGNAGGLHLTVASIISESAPKQKPKTVTGKSQNTMCRLCTGILSWAPIQGPAKQITKVVACSVCAKVTFTAYLRPIAYDWHLIISNLLIKIHVRLFDNDLLPNCDFCQCCESGMVIPVPGFSFSYPGSRVDKIPEPESKSPSKNLSVFYPKKLTQVLRNLGMFIPDPGFGLFSIPDSGSRGQKSTGSRIRKTAFCFIYHRYCDQLTKVYCACVCTCFSWAFCWDWIFC
jgi:hypothetical protein